MGIIHLLDSTVSNKIAAGEVVERPSSVVKELAENSIDAGAESITIEIKSGGREYIRVSDNGCGMSAEDAQICFLRHATSKVRNDEDLDAIYTLGFRGEALSSIGAVAKVSLITKRAEDEGGVRVTCRGGEILSSEDAGVPNGTTVIVEDLFFNTPARQKFLKKDATEAGYITDIATRLIFAHPEISIKLIVNGREKLYSAGDNSLLNAVYTVYGKDYARHMREAAYEGEGIAVAGLVSVGTAARANRNYQSFFVNGRYIKSPMMTRALEEAYKNQIMVGKYPVAVLNVKIDPSLTDINVHPTKLEVKFSNERDIYRAVFYAVSNALYREANVPRIEKSDDAENSENRLYLSDMAAELPKTAEKPPFGGGSVKRPPMPNYNPRQNPFSRGGEQYSLGDFESRSEKSDSPSEDEDKFVSAYVPHSAPNAPLTVREPERTGSILDAPAEQRVTSARAERAEEERGNVFVDEYFRIVGQIFDTYIIAEKGDEMLIVDQHAAHERLKFEELKRHIENKEPFSQLLIEPVVVTVNADEYAAFEENCGQFNAMGFDCGTFGEDAVIVRAVPGEVEIGEVENLILELIGAAKNLKNDITTDKQLRLLETIACKSAVKANMRLSEDEAAELLRNVLRMKNINTCPHGRPIVITMSKRELEKQFGRIM
ncbi:MAG: DNA mismatch repair endonuclease MutL [Firmicutes bacterium]|nr:DNA mismatch repair endonuclease MutL [Bacillota bacterium]